MNAKEIEAEKERLRAIAKKGGLALKKKYGNEYLKELGRRGGMAKWHKNKKNDETK